MIKFFEPSICAPEISLINKTVRNGFISSQTAIVRRFEEDFAKWHNVKFAISTSNCTTALHLSLLALDIGVGDEVICTNLTFIAPANMIAHTGAKLVLVDIDEKTFSMNIQEIKKKITNKTKAILVVHAFGYPANIKEIQKIAKLKKIKIIEDVAEAIGAKSNGALCGTIGDVSCFSFFANKLITTGEGGMILTNNKNIYNKAKILRDHGMTEQKKYYHKYLAFNYRMTSMQAALGICQLKRLKSILKKKEKINYFYDKL
jgi:perosamine synthetase